jgi:thiosulfate reductase/polysulfide reductase chain A
MRVGKRGKQTFKPVGWDEAFDHIADKMRSIAEVHGPECVALFTHGSGGNILEIYLRPLAQPTLQHLHMLNAAVRVK